jgi:hypothetical protein
MPEWKIGNVTGHGRPVYGAIARLVRLGYVEAAAMDDICSLYKHWQITAAGRDYLARVDGES